LPQRSDFPGVATGASFGISPAGNKETPWIRNFQIWRGVLAGKGARAGTGGPTRTGGRVSVFGRIDGSRENGATGRIDVRTTIESRFLNK